jgi:hypothetical protein
MLVSGTIFQPETNLPIEQGDGVSALVDGFIGEIGPKPIQYIRAGARIRERGGKCPGHTEHDLITYNAIFSFSGMFTSLSELFPNLRINFKQKFCDNHHLNLRLVAFVDDGFTGSMFPFIDLSVDNDRLYSMILSQDASLPLISFQFGMHFLVNVFEVDTSSFANSRSSQYSDALIETFKSKYTHQ